MRTRSTCFIPGIPLRVTQFSTATGKICFPCACAAAVPDNVPCVPNDVPSLVSVVAGAYAAAGHPPRTRVEALIPGLNPALEETFPYSDRLLCDLALGIARAVSNGRHVRLLFKSAGTAAAASQYYATGSTDGPLGDNISLGSFYKRDADRTGKRLVEPGELGFFVSPSNSLGDPVILDIENIVETAPVDTSWILLNSDFAADRSALGLAEQGRRNEFLNTFLDVFYFRNVFIIQRPKLVPVEKGALLRVYPAPYILYRLTGMGEEYEPVSTFANMPQRNQITDALEVGATRVVSLEDKLGSFNEDDKSFLQHLLALAVLSFVLFWYLRVSTFNMT